MCRILSRRRRTYIRVPKTDHRYLGFRMSGSRQIHGRGQSDRRTACTPPQKLRSEHNFARTHRMVAEATGVAAQHAEAPKLPISERHGHSFWNHKSAPQAHFSLREKIIWKINFRAEGALTFECQRRTIGTLVFACSDPVRFMEVVRATDGPRAPHHRSGGASAALPGPTEWWRRTQESRPGSFWNRISLIIDRHAHRFWNHKSAPQAHFCLREK